MTYQPNPDAPIASEEFPEQYARYCYARAFVEDVLAKYVWAVKERNMSKPTPKSLKGIMEILVDDVENDLNIDDEWCVTNLGEHISLHDNELQKLIEENWR